MKRMVTNKTHPKELLYPELSYAITGILFKVHNELGQYAREKQYGDTLEQKFQENGILFERESRIGDSNNILDFIVNNQVAIELKTKRILLKADYEQVQRYLQETGLKLCLLVNFRNKYIKPVRIIRIENYKITH